MMTLVLKVNSWKDNYIWKSVKQPLKHGGQEFCRRVLIKTPFIMCRKQGWRKNQQTFGFKNLQSLLKWKSFYSAFFIKIAFFYFPFSESGNVFMKPDYLQISPVGYH